MKIFLEVIRRIFLLIFVCHRTIMEDGTIVIASDADELHARVAQHELANNNNVISVSINGITYSRSKEDA